MQCLLCSKIGKINADYRINSHAPLSGWQTAKFFDFQSCDPTVLTFNVFVINVLPKLLGYLIRFAT